MIETMKNKYADFYLNSEAWTWPYKPMKRKDVDEESPLTNDFLKRLAAMMEIGESQEGRESRESREIKACYYAGTSDKYQIEETRNHIVVRKEEEPGSGIYVTVGALKDD